MDDLQSIMTSQAVALESRPANVATRAVASVIDFAFYAALEILAIAGLSNVMWEFNGAQFDTFMTVLIALPVLVIPTAVETLTHGRSLGKIVMGTRVVRDDGGPISFRHAVTRWGTGLIEVFLTFGMLAFTVAMLTPRNKRLGDLLAGTYVARVRGTDEYEYPILMPPELAGWAALADMRALPDQVSMYARKFLTRTGQLSPQARARLGTMLAAEVEQYVAPPAPQGTHPERFLAAVLAERRDREYAVAQQQEAAAAAEQRELAALPFGIR